MDRFTAPILWAMASCATGAMLRELFIGEIALKTCSGLALAAVLAFALSATTAWAQDASSIDASTETATESDAPADAAAMPAVADIPLASPDARAIREASAADAWGGPRQPGDATLSDRVVAYDIDVELDPEKHTLDGKQKLTWRNRSNVAVGSIYLHLYLNAFRSEGSTYFTESRENGFAFRSDVATEEGDWGYTDLKKVEQNGQEVSWEFVHPDGGPETDMTVVRFDLPEPVMPGASTTLDIDFHAQLPRVVARTGYFDSFHLIGQWFPKIAVLELPGERGATEPRWNAHEFHLHSEFYADFGSFDVRITVPEAYTVGATGKLQGEPTVADGKRTSRYVQDDVIDFAWTAFDRYGELNGEWTYEGSPDVSIRVLYPTEYEDNAAPALKATQDSLTWFSDTLGAYPYETVTVVIPPNNAGEAGGMEYPTFFTADSVDDYEPGTIGAWGLDFVTIHEFGHGYFMGILASNEFEEPMLDEGLNEYWDQRMMRDREQDIPLSFAPLKWFGIKPKLPAFEMERLGARLADGLDGMGENSWNRYSSGSYGSVYSRTATTMRDLEDLLGRVRRHLLAPRLVDAARERVGVPVHEHHRQELGVHRLLPLAPRDRLVLPLVLAAEAGRDEEHEDVRAPHRAEAGVVRRDARLDGEVRLLAHPDVDPPLHERRAQIAAGRVEVLDGRAEEDDEPLAHGALSSHPCGCPWAFSARSR